MPIDDTRLAAACAGDEQAFRSLIEPHRRELRAHCYRMSGSLHDADDLLQESLLKAWRSIGGFEGRSSLRTWLYRVATSACLDALSSRAGRSLPSDLRPPSTSDEPMLPPVHESIWLEPCPETLYQADSDDDGSPEARLDARQSVALAFLAALQVLPAKQRAVLILRDVLGYQAAECAEMLELSVASANSALQRARDTLAERSHRRTEPRLPDERGTVLLLGRYMRAWEEADVTTLVALLREDATLAMPPMPMWLQGAGNIGASIGMMVLTPDARGVFRMTVSEANGCPAVCAYKRDAATGEFRGYAIQVLELVEGGEQGEGGVASIMAFLDPSLFERFGLPSTLPPR